MEPDSSLPSEILSGRILGCSPVSQLLKIVSEPDRSCEIFQYLGWKLAGSIIFQLLCCNLSDTQPSSCLNVSASSIATIHGAVKLANNQSSYVVGAGKKMKLHILYQGNQFFWSYIITIFVDFTQPKLYVGRGMHEDMFSLLK